MTTTSDATLSDAGATSPEDMRTEVKLGASVEETIAKLKANKFQYASAGDTKRLVEHVATLSAREGELKEMEQRKDDAYFERNQIVAALARIFPSGIAKTNIPGWSEDWHGCVYIDLPTGQVSWHYHDSHAYLFDALPPYKGKWDGHDTPLKYKRLAAALASPSPTKKELPSFEIYSPEEGDAAESSPTSERQRALDLSGWTKLDGYWPKAYPGDQQLMLQTLGDDKLWHNEHYHHRALAAAAEKE